jgi:two-component system sensor histidine kinase TorS
LAIARQLTEAIGGGLHFESEPGQGTRFVLTVPLRLGDPAQIETESAVETNSQFDLDVLVIEDHPVNLLVARGLLEKLGCRVTDAPDGRTGLDLAAKVRFDLVLIDLGLPDIDGERVARELRARPDPPRMAALTAHLIDDTPDERERIGVDAILGKPVSPRALVGLLEGVAGQALAARAPEPEERPDASVLAVLRGDIDTMGAETVQQILAAFLSDLPEGLAALAAASGAERARAAHRLKGAASNFALHRFCARLAEIEKTPDQPCDDLGALAQAARSDLEGAARALGLHSFSGGTSL